MMKNLLKFPKFAQLTGTRGLALMAMAAILLVCGSQPAAAQTRYLTPGGAGSGNGIDWGNAYPSVESALSLMPPGTTLLIKEGTYYPKVTSPLGFPITYPVKFYGGCAGTETSPIGRSGGPTIFDGAASWGTAKHVVNISRASDFRVGSWASLMPCESLG